MHRQDPCSTAGHGARVKEDQESFKEEEKLAEIFYSVLPTTSEIALVGKNCSLMFLHSTH